MRLRFSRGRWRMVGLGGLQPGLWRRNADPYLHEPCPFLWRRNLLRQFFTSVQHTMLRHQRRLERLGSVFRDLRRRLPDQNMHQSASFLRWSRLLRFSHSRVQYPGVLFPGRRGLEWLERLFGHLRRRHPDKDMHQSVSFLRRS